MSEILLIGIDSSGLSPEKRKLLQECSLIVASKRLAETIDDLQVPIIPVTPLQDACRQIEEVLPFDNVAVLASGDPFFYGIGDTLIRHFGNERITVLPALSSMQEAFARFRIPWHDAKIISLHGRHEHHIPGLLLQSQKTFVFTDSTNTPATIANAVCSYLDCIGSETLKKEIRVHIAEAIGSAEETITSASLMETAEMQFNALNVVCFALPQEVAASRFGLGEADICHSRGLITKDEIRAATLHRLNLPRQGVFWDVGGGSGSVSIEAAAINPGLCIYTIEQKDEELLNIRKNIRRFHCYNVIPVAGKASEVIDRLPAPDAVFIGGSGGELEQIIKKAADRLTGDGRIVVNGVTHKTVSQAPQYMRDNGLKVECSTIEVSRSGAAGQVSFNPITIMVGKR